MDIFKIILYVITLILLGKILTKPNFFKIKKIKSKITYRNLYIGQGSNTYVFGLNEYSTKESAKRNQKCPPGYRWHSAIHSREWV